jgi:EAL domain-containing protein (putative c-di-GMP-specific phosphodiesterase class I)
VFVHPFIGVTEVDPNESLLVNLDNAILARNISENNFESITFYSPSFRKSATLTEIDEIKQALLNQEFVVYYQPKFHLASHRFISSEALVRWDSKQYGLLSPAKFLEKAELGGLIHELDMYVFRRVCQNLAEARVKNKRILPVSINFSLYEFYDPSFVDDILGIIKEFKLNPSFVEIEITESTSQVNPFMAISLLKKLKECGFRILMDDFGLAYSNLGNLNKMPFDTIKIDKSFVDGIVPDFKTREIVRFLISLCKVSGMEVIAEGVDQAEQVNILRKIKCDTIQGFYYSKPLPIKEYEEFLQENPFEKAEGGNNK